MFALCLAILTASDARLHIRETFFTAPLTWRTEFSNAMLLVLVCCTVVAGYITQQAVEAEYKIVRAIHLSNAAVKLQTSGGTQSTERKALLLQNIREGIAINSHYRKLTPMVADHLSDIGDWVDAVWIWESVAASRPHISVIWSNIARGFAQLGEYNKAFEALHKWQRLQPDAPGSLALEVTLLSRTQQEPQAAQLLTSAYNQDRYDLALLHAGYALGLKTKNLPLAIRSLELRNQNWPEQAPDGYFRLGKIYADPALHDDIKALAAFRAGLASVPENQKENFRSQVPMPYRNQL
jgi:tetratricopeptide (TPR) repeat protein